MFAHSLIGNYIKTIETPPAVKGKEKFCLKLQLGKCERPKVFELHFYGIENLIVQFRLQVTKILFFCEKKSLKMFNGGMGLCPNS